MPQTLSDKSVFSLQEVTQSIRKTLKERYKSSFWVIAEMNKLNLYAHSGHCYPELVEKKEGKIVAQLKGIIWKEDYQRINNQFQVLLNESLHNGIKILFHAQITFDSSYGLSLHILDIDPSYSLGELEREKQESIARLKKEGLFERNKQLSFPLLPKRIAIISVETSKGYADFRSIMDGNPWGYTFFYMLFPAVLQGEKAIASIRQQLSRIKKVQHHFDVVTIIRGGGGDVGLSCYNNYLLSREITEFPLPVLTGIGHATNETVSEMVSHHNAITPTALADMLIQTFHNFSVPVKNAQETLSVLASQLLEEEKLTFQQFIKNFHAGTRHLLQQGKHDLDQQAASLLQHAGFASRKEREQFVFIPSRIRRALASVEQQQQFRLRETSGRMYHNASAQINTFRQELNAYYKIISLKTNNVLMHAGTDLHHLERMIDNLGPDKMLKRGYSITRVNGKSISSVTAINTAEKLETTLADGKIISIAEKITRKNKS